jgi:hypothetical protein
MSATAMKNAPDLEAVINYLTGPVDLQIYDLIKALGIERSYFYSWRRSTKRDRRTDMAQRLIALFSQHFPDGEIPSQAYSGSGVAKAPDQPTTSASERKYIELLEKTVEDLRAERDRLRQEVETLLREVKDGVGKIQKRLDT